MSKSLQLPRYPWYIWPLIAVSTPLLILCAILAGAARRYCGWWNHTYDRTERWFLRHQL